MGGWAGAAGRAPNPKLPDSGRTGALGAGFLSGGGGGIGGVGFTTTKIFCSSGTSPMAVQLARPSVHTKVCCVNSYKALNIKTIVLKSTFCATRDAS